MSTVQDPRKIWLATENLCAVWEEMPSLGPSLPLSFRLGLALPASLPPAGDWPVRSQLAVLWYSLSPLFCEWDQQYLRLELFAGKFSLSFFFPSSLAIPRFGLLSHFSSLRLPSGHSVLTLSSAAHASLFSPRLLVAEASIWATSPLEVGVRTVICGFYLFIFSSL